MYTKLRIAMAKNETSYNDKTKHINSVIILSWILFVLLFFQNAHTGTDTERRMSCPKPFERIADHKADSRLLFTYFSYHELLLPLSVRIVYVFFFGFAGFDFSSSDANDNNDM